MPTPRLLAVDLDGTLLDRDGVPHERDVRALRALAAAGLRVSIVTGRLWSGTQATAAALGLDGPVGCVDGSHLVCARTSATLLHRGICGERARLLRELLAGSGAAVFVFARDLVIYDGAGEAHLDCVLTWSRALHRARRVLDDASWEDDVGLTGVVAVGGAASIAEAARRVSHSVAETRVVTFAFTRKPELHGLVVREAGVDKGSALEWIARHHGIDIGETVCVGDWLNDLPMFLRAGRSYAMAQAPDELRRAATAVLEESGEQGGGIARVVETVFGVRVP